MGRRSPLPSLLGLWLLCQLLGPALVWAQADGARVLPTPGGAGLARQRPPPSRAIRSAARCKARIVDQLKQQRCLSCVERGGAFHEQGQGAGFCVERDQQLLRIRRLKGCTLHLGQRGERRSCLRCLKQGGIYRYWSKGMGACSAPRLAAPLLEPAQPRLRPGEVRLLEGCAAKIRRTDKRQRCAACLKQGGIFLRQGAGPGSCARPPPGPPLPGPAGADSLKLALRRGLGSDRACREELPQAPLRRRCQRCVEQGGWFYPRRKLCGPPQGVTPLRSLAECPLRLSGPDALARCRECLRQGGKYYPGGYCHVKPPPLPAEEREPPEETSSPQ